MSIPRITLWTKPVDIPLRFAVRPFNDKLLTAQTHDIQSNQHVLKVTAGAMYIASSIVGRRVPEPVRWVILDSLQDILAGNLRNEHPEGQDIFASTLGEILGVILMALKLGNTLDFVRLLESNEDQTPDFIVFENTAGGRIPHLLECKGSVEDVYNTNDRGKLDICQHIRSFRKRGKEQLDNINYSKLKAGGKISVSGSKMPFGFSKGVATKNLSIVIIPDGRLLRTMNASAGKSPRKICEDNSFSCKRCITNIGNNRLAGAVAVLHQDKVNLSTTRWGQIGQFLRKYQDAQKALWTENDDVYDDQVAELFEMIRSPQLEGEERATAAYLTLALLDVANKEGMAVESLPIEVVTHSLPDNLRERAVKTIQAGHQERDSPKKRVSRTQDDDAALARIRNLGDLDEKVLINRGSLEAAGIRGTVQYVDDATLIRLMGTGNLGSDFENLKNYVESIIAGVRRSRSPIEWRREYAEFQGRHIDFGLSWDKYPYPNLSPTSKLPGITAWISNDGRAEVIIRHESLYS